jgi:hypothetical protein
MSVFVARLGDLLSTSVFVARLRRNTFHERLCGASEATYFQEALKWRLSEEPLSTSVFVALQRVSLVNPPLLGHAPVLKFSWKGRKLPSCVTAPDINEEERQP